MPHDVTPGAVQLVGAGPGPADLLTLRAARAIEGAQAILYDALVDETVLTLAPRACLRIQTGKRGGRASMDQQTINGLMLRLARQGLNVVRLKGGDPSIFGRCGEEQAFLEARGVAVTVIPGVTAACAAAAQFGFPLTHRGAARRVAFATARVEGGALEEGHVQDADPDATLVLYMARDSAAQASARLIAQGRSPRTPAVAVENAGADDARLIKGTLATLPALLGLAQCRGPVVLVIGETAALARHGPVRQAGRGDDRRMEGA